MRNICLFDPCDRLAHSNYLCRQHDRQRRSGRPLRAVRGCLRGVPLPTCAAEGCNSKAASRNISTLCHKHQLRVARHGTLQCVGVYNSLAGELNHNWVGDDVGYGGLHARVRIAFGRANDNKCVWCGSQAAQWAYDHTCPNEKQSDIGPYSVDLAKYQPMCRPCHATMDGVYRKAHR
jgi:hypothetical protein